MVSVEIEDNEIITGNRMMKNLHCHGNAVNFAKTDFTPEGYMTVEEFRKEAKTSLTKLLNEHGIY